MICHLVIPDLLHTAHAGPAPCSGLALPALETLFARGSSSRLTDTSLERWLAATFGITGEQDLPLAALNLLGDGGDPASACWLKADPLHLRVHRDQLLLTAMGSLSLTTREAEELTRALSNHFAEDGLAFIAPHPEHWYLRLAETPRIRTTPTAEVVGRPIEPLLPQGDDGPRWRRIINEAQMLLHEHPCNEAREARGALPVNSVWLWGAGKLPTAGRASPYAAIWSVHSLARGIAAATGLSRHDVPESGTRFLEHASKAGSAPELVILEALTPALGAGLEAWRAALLHLEERWFAPLLDGLKRGALSSLTVHALGSEHRSMTATRRDVFKFWRARRPLSHYVS